MAWWAALVLVLPCVFSSAVMHVTDVPRLILLSVFSLVFFLYFYVFRTWKRESLALSRWNKLLAWLTTGFGVVLVITSFTAVNKQEALDCTIRFLLTAVVTALFAATIVREEPLLGCLFKALVVVLLAQALFGILQFYNVAFTGIPPQKDDVPYGLMAHRTVFSSALALLFPFCAYVIYDGNRRWRILCGFALWFGVYGIILGRTRSVWLAVAASLVLTTTVVMVLRRRLGPSLVKGWFQAMAWFVLGTIAAAVLAVTVSTRAGFNRELSDRAKSVIQLSEKHTMLGSGAFRWVMWRRSLEMLRDHPLLGVGPGNWRVVVPEYGAEGLDPIFRNGSVLRDHAHNVFLQTAAECGFAALCLFLAIWIVSAVLMLDVVVSTQDNRRRMLGIVSLAVLCIYSVDSFFNFPNEIISHSLFLALGLGTAVGLNQKLARPTVPAAPSRWRATGPLLVTPFLLFCVYFACTKARFEYHNVRARALVKMHRPGDVLAEVEAGLNPLVTISHYGDPLEYYSACAYAELGRPEEALQAIQRADRLNPGNIFTKVKLGEIYGNMNRLDDAIQSYDEAFRMTPLFEDALKGLAVAYYNKGLYQACCDTLNRFHYQDDVRMVCQMGYSCFNLQQYDRSAAVLREGLRQFPDDVELIEFLGTLEYSKLQDKTNAYEHLQRLLALSPNHPKREEYLKAIRYLAPQVGKGAGDPTEPGVR